MKTILCLLLVSFTLHMQSQCVRTASFEDANYEVAGTVTVEFNQNNTKFVKIGSDFSTMEGPDLYVYLANTQTVNTSSGIPAGTVELGLLSSVSGASEYVMPSNIQINDYSYVVIQCKQFNVAWGFASLGVAQGESCSALSINDNNFDTINFFPNPAKNKISFNTNSNKSVLVTIYNYSGVKMLQKNINYTSKDIDLNNLSSGIYLVEVGSGERKSAKKLIIK